MRLAAVLFCLGVVLHCSYAPPVTEKKEQDSVIKDDLEEYMEYHRYLKEVVQALESDPDFRERLEKADEDDVRSGKIAEQLDFVNHNVRTKLDEIKRRELERLRHLATKQFELTNDLDTDMGKVPTNEHLDHVNPHTFEIEDLKKLIKKTTADLEAADKQRKEEFKEYEMQKEFEKNLKMEKMEETAKKEYMEKLKEEEEAKKHHQPLHHPGSKQQLEEVWEKQDHMDQQFNPKAFFMMHDVDGNGVWDADEVKALFVKELDKLYGPGGPNKDKHERAEEMERMREHVFKENDLNRNGLIEFHEFLQETQKADFNRDEGWKSIDENQIYTQAEYDEFQRRRHDEISFLLQRGLVDAYGRPLPGAGHKIHDALQEFHRQRAYENQFQQAHPGQQQYQQVPAQYHTGNQPAYQAPQYQGQPGQVQYQGHPQQAQLHGQQPPQQQFHGQQVPQQQFQGQQPPQQQFQGQQHPQQQYQGQQPPQQQFQGQQPPQQQFQGQQLPKQQLQGQQPQQQQGQGQTPQNYQGQPQQNAPAQQNLNVNQQAPVPVQGQAQGQVQQQGQGQAPPVQGQPQAQTVQNQLGQGQQQPQAQAPPHN